MECEMCNFKCTKQSNFETHIKSEKHIKLELFIKKKLEEANVASILREQKLKQEIVKADDKFKECQLKAFNTNTKMELINLKMFQHLRDHDIDLTTNDYHSKLSTIETSFVSSKSACESVFHDNLTNILFKSMDTNSVNNCYLCSEFKQYSNKLLNQSDFIESECLNETGSDVSVKEFKKTNNTETCKPLDIKSKTEKKNKQKGCKEIKVVNANKLNNSLIKDYNDISEYQFFNEQYLNKKKEKSNEMIDYDKTRSKQLDENFKTKRKNNKLQLQVKETKPQIEEPCKEIAYYNIPRKREESLIEKPGCFNARLEVDKIMKRLNNEYKSESNV
jgi:hypothetical protein